MHKKAIINFAIASVLQKTFAEKYYKVHKFKIAYPNPIQESPSTTTSQDPPTTPTFSHTSQPQYSTRISSVEKPYTFGERQASLSQPLLPAICQYP